MAKPGRARRDETEVRETILTAASTVFMTEGFAAASVGAIAKAGGVSTKTIYRFYETKADILVAVIASFMADILPGFDTYRVEHAAELEPTLCRLLRDLGEYGLNEGGLAAQRLAVTEVMRVPEMIAAYYREGHEKIIAALGTWLGRQAEAGHIALDDANQTAAMLISMAFADLTRDAMVSGEPPPAAEIDRWVKAAVGIFLRGVARPA